MKKIKYIIMSLVIFLLDLSTKIMIASKLKLYESREIIKNFFYITYTKNKGAAFGLLENYRIIVLIVTIAIFAYLLYRIIKKEKDPLSKMALAYVIGGLLGNLGDRLFLGYVRDFLDFRFGSYNFAIFNVGDIFIVIGCILYIVRSFMEEKNANNSK